jgi:hypothetical protein
MEHTFRKGFFLELFLNSIPFTLDLFRYTVSFFWRENKLLILKFEDRFGMLGLSQGISRRNEEEALKNS